MNTPPPSPRIGRLSCWSVLAFAFLVFLLPVQAFVHPGIPFTTEDIAQLKAHVANGDQPWTGAYQALAGDGRSKLTYTGNPQAAVSRAPDVNRSQFANDMAAIHNLTWIWLFTGNAAYAQKATDLLDAWAVTNTYFGGDEGCLELGDYVEKLVTAADILKAMYPGWTTANTEHVRAWFADVLWPVGDVPNPVRGANQGAIQLKISISIAAFLDDTTKWDQALTNFRGDAGGGLANSLPNGQVGDTGRDDGHWIGQIQALAWCAEVAWKQGVDLFSEYDNRLLAASELWAAWSLKQPLPPLIPHGGSYEFHNPGDYAGGIAPYIRRSYAYNLIENGYVRRLGLAAPKTLELRTAAGDDAITFLFKKTTDASTATLPAPIVHPSSTPAVTLANRDVGDVGLAGSASYDSGTSTWTVKGAGADIPIPPLTEVDAFNFAFHPVAGDAVIVARLTSVENTHGSAKAGIMIRESLTADAKYVGLFVGPGGGATTTWRGATAWNKTNVSWNNPPGGYQGHGGPTAPWWMKIERRGSRIHVQHSPDGVNWTGIQAVEIALPETAYLGLCVTAHNRSALNTSTFDNVAITNPAPAGAPIITSPAAAEATVGAAFNYHIVASGSPTNYAATNLPAGLSFDAETGVISGTPTAPGTAFVTLNATNDAGTGSALCVLTIFADAAPPPPTEVAVTPVNVYDVKIAWTASPNATSYTIKRSTASGGPYTTIATGVSGTSFVDFTASSGDNYYIVTALAGPAESAASAEALIPLPSAIPERPAIANGDSQVTLTWAAADGDATYTIKRATSSGGPYTIVAAGVTTTSYTDTGLSNGTYYYYVVSSVSTAESANSPEEFGLPGAKTYTWSPTATSGAWSTASNWVEGMVPSSPAILNFGASTTTTLNNDLPGLEVARFTFDATAGAYTIGGNAITLGTEITNNSSELQSIQVPMTVNRSVNSNANAGRIRLGSHTAGVVISGPGGFVTRGSEMTAFLGANTFSGGVTAYGNSSGTLSNSRNVAFSGVGTAAAGPFGTGRVTLHQATISDTLPLAAPTTRNVLYNEIHLVEGTKNVLFTGGAGALDFYGKLTGGGQIEANGWNSGWDFYSGSPHFYGDNREFTGTFVTITRSSWQRLQFRSATSGSAKARFSIGGNISATQSINGATVSFGELSSAGSLNGLGTSGLIVGELNTDSTFSGVLYGSLALTKRGTGTFTLSFVNTYSGPTLVEAGALRLIAPGSINSAVTVNDSATFGGNGAGSSTVTVNAGGTLAPGDRGSGLLAIKGNVTLNTGATFAVALKSSVGTAGGLKAPQVALNNATLKLNDIAAGALPAGTVLTLIHNTGTAAINGTFADRPEASQLTLNGNVYRLSYRGGDGNDVVLYDERTAPALITSPATASGKLTTPFSYTITALGSPTSFGATGLPAGLSVDATTGVISGTPDDVGTFTVTLTATNTHGTGVGTLTLTIGAINPPSAPAALTATAVSNESIALAWPATRYTSGYAVKRATTAGGPYSTVATATSNSYQDQGLSNASTYYYVVAALNDVGASANSPEASATPVRNALLDTFSSADVGAVGVAGSSTYDAAGVVTMQGSGADIWGNADGFRYFHRPMTGDGAIVARVLSLQNTHPAAKAGVMMRESLEPGSRHALANLTAVNGVEFIRRQATNSGTSAASTGGVSAPRWMRLVRAGNSFSAFHSSDGITWTAIGGPISIGMSASPITVGLAVNSHNNPVLALARFDHINIATAVPTITSATAAAGTYGAPFSYAIQATNTPYLYTASSLPPGLNLDADTGIISGTPSAAGAYTVTLRAFNAMGASSEILALTIAKADAVVILDNLVQRYDGTPREAAPSTTPDGLTVNLTYAGSPTPPVYPGAYDVVATVDDPNYAGTATGTLRIAATATVRRGFTLDGMIDGSAQVLAAESVTLNGESTLSSDLLVPGMPKVMLNGSPTLAGVKDGPGVATPKTHTVTLNGDAVARYVVRRIDAVALPAVTAPPAPAGTRDVTLSSSGQSLGDPATLRNLTLNGGAGVVVIPPGTYGTFTANGGSHLVFGVAGATEPAVYNLHGLTLNGPSGLQLAGPVTLTLASGLTVNAIAGDAAHPEWLTLRVASGGVTLNTGAALHGSVLAPSGTVSIGAAASLHGAIRADRLQIATDGLLEEPEL